MTMTLEKAGLLPYHLPFNPVDMRPTMTGLAIDVETTGLDHKKDKVIELALLPFEYCPKRRVIIRMLAPLSFFQDPGEPITEEITRITGITTEMVAGQNIDREAVRSALADASLVVAHNAAFDRPFLDALFPESRALPWACSMSEIAWSYGSRSLEFLVYKHCRKYYDAHRAVNDCAALLHLLNQEFPDGENGFYKLLESARKKSYRLWALGSAFEYKDELKARGYRWNTGTDGRYKSWYRDVSEDEKDAEMQYLSSIGCRMSTVEEFNAYTRYKGE